MPVTIDYSNALRSSLLMEELLKHERTNSSLELTCASAKTDPYFRYVLLTQRILKDDTVIGYVCYRSKQPTKEAPIRFSSYELYDENFDQSKAVKIHLADTDPKDAFGKVLLALIEMVDNTK